MAPACAFHLAHPQIWLPGVRAMFQISAFIACGLFLPIRYCWTVKNNRDSSPRVVSASKPVQRSLKFFQERNLRLT
jgi:hypothetical protein